ncbi:MAG: hypothetical protein JNM93_12330 [Bacteriovoracaceae bacterium]|nr:hypothetical protein [Bacteriovoracaceae bacterium]
MRTIRVIQFSLLFLLVASCSSYTFTKRDNPFSQYGINVVYVPTFYNKSVFSNVSANFTREIKWLLSEYPGLEVTESPDKADAVLIGIIDSKKKMTQAIQNEGYRVSSEVAPNSVNPANRNQFYVPAITSINLSVRFILIKHPTESELALLQTSLGDKIESSSKVVFNQELFLTEQFNREIYDKTAGNDAGNVNATQNRGALQRTLKNLAVSAKQNFKDLIIYAF